MNTLRGTRRAPWPRKEEELDASLQSAREHGTLRWAAEDGAQAIRAFRAQDFDIVLTDLAMPGYSGLQVAEACRRQRPSVKVVMFTAWHLLLDDDQCVHHGVDRLIPKPLRMSSVLEALHQVGNHPRFQRAPRTHVERAAVPRLTMTIETRIIARWGLDVGIGRLRRGERVMILVMLSLAAALGWWFAGLVGTAVGVGLALLAYSVTRQLWALLQASRAFQFIVAGALVILSVVTFVSR